MRKLITIALLGAAAAATPAYAQDAEVAPSGLHVFAIGGYDKVDGDGPSAEGIVYGVGGGYDFGVTPDFTLGIEGELSSAATEDCVAGFERPGDNLCFEAGRDIYIGGRVGLRVGGNPNSLFYLGGGYTNTSVDLDYDANLPGTGDDLSLSEDSDGLRGKVGAEIGLGRNLFVKAEYRYSWYDEEEIERHQAVAGIGFRF